MFRRSLPNLRGPAAILATVAAILTGIVDPAAAAWERFHGDPANNGFVDVVTAPAASGSRSVPGLGTFAPGVGPVIGPDGTVYLATLEGKVIALHADGSPFWSRDITRGQSIQASPAVGADGTIYVVGIKTTSRNISGLSKRTIFEATLHRFLPGGALLGQTPFPPHGDGGATTAAPNIVRVGGTEVVLVPALYFNPPIRSIRLIGFSPAGGVVIDQSVSNDSGEITGGSDLGAWILAPVCLIPPIGPLVCLACAGDGCSYNPSVAGGPAPTPPFPGVAVFSFAGGGAPWVIMSNRIHDIVGYTFSAPATLTETFRAKQGSLVLTSPPMVLPDGHSLVGTADGQIVFAGPNGSKLTPVKGLGSVLAAPTRTAHGQVVVVAANGLTLLGGGKVLSHAALPSPSYVAAAASRSHVFVSTRDGLITFDPDAQVPLQTFDWVGGGVSPPAIGADGRVYAIASNILFVFPPPKTVSKPLQDLTTTTTTQGGTRPVLGGAKVAPAVGVLQPLQQGTAAPQPASQTFQPPMTKSGKRLYACQDFDGHGCGAPVAASFCQQQGFAKADKIDTQYEKVQAETLDGRLCDKKKCRVFDLIVCSK